MSLRRLPGRVAVALVVILSGSAVALAQAVSPPGSPAAKGAPAKTKPGSAVSKTPAPPLPLPNPRRTEAGEAAAPSAPDAGVGPAPAPDPAAAEAKDQSPASEAAGNGEAATATPAAAPATSATDASAPPAVAGPVPASPEAQYMAALDALIAPVRDLALTAEDQQRLKEAVRLGATGDLSGSRAARSQITEPAARKLSEWIALRGGLGEAQDFAAFIAANPGWPDRQLLTRRAEEQLFTGGGSSQRIRAFFKDAEPRTGAGWAALASAYLVEGDEAKARAAAAKAWRELEIAVTLEQGFLERFGKLLTPDDHRRRFDRILVDEVRFTAERADRAAIARRLIPLMGEAEQKKAEARLAIFLRAKNAAQLLSALPAEKEGQPTDWGLQYQKVQHFRRVGQYEEARKILLAAPTDPELIVSPDDWWVERRAAAHEALRDGKPEAAYELVRKPGPLSVNPLKDQTFLAGWITLRHLAKADVALAHFEASRAAADGPLSRTRAEYWLGRALEGLGRPDEAQKRYRAAGTEIDTFHGQLGHHKVNRAAAIDIRPSLPAMPTAEQAAQFNANDAVRAAVIVAKSGLDQNLRRSLFAQLRNHLPNEADLAMLAHLAAALGDPQTSLRVGKTAIARGMNLIMYGYPLHTFPGYTPLRDPPEPAMLLGIARQETEFNSAIVSSAGARGLLQVMPITAQHICRDHKIKCDLPRLLTDNSYNAMIASAYIGDRLADFRGNYVLTLAGYNAGPGRARQWIRDFGDPRDAAVDPIDWIERIPIEETREYVKKVLANVQIYRARLGDPSALRLEQDLTRTIGGRRAADAAR